MQDADDVFAAALAHRQAGMVTGTQLGDDFVEVVVNVDHFQLVPGHHHVVDSTVFQFEQVEQHRAVFLGDELPAFQHQYPQFLGGQLGRLRLGLHPQQADQPLHEQVDEPDDGIRHLEEQGQRIAGHHGHPFGVRGGNHFRGGFGKHQNGERDQHRGHGQRHFVLADQPEGDDRGDGGSGRVDEIVAKQDDAQQLVGLPQQVLGQPGATMATGGTVVEAVAVDRHHAGFRHGEKRRRHQQDDQGQQQQG